ncbi:CopG family transcriptional regulator [bacterium]|nr:CopG family transcriptional regulator [bacterium]
MPRGGHRPGAGRKAAGGSAKGQPVAVRLSPDVLLEIDRLTQDLGLSRSGVVERLLRQALAKES